VVGETWSSAVHDTSARLSAEIDPNGLVSTYHFDYIADAAYQANVGTGKDGFTGALRSPPASEAAVLPGGPPSYTRQLFGLGHDTVYRYRVVAKNSAGSAPPSPTHFFVTQSLPSGVLLPDSRGWEMVSPVQKNGGQVDPPGAIAGGGVLQGAADGGSATFGSTASFAGGGGAPPASQYIASRTGGGWTTQNITAPIFSGTFAVDDQGVPYQLFSGDLARGLLLNGDHCRSAEVGDCAVANPPLAGTDAPAGYQNYYFRENGAFAALLTSADAAELDFGPAAFDLLFAGASPDLRHVVLSTCAALTSDATEVPQGPGCDATEQNLYRWSAGSGLSLVNLLPGQTQGNHAAVLGAQAGAVSTDGDRIYWFEPGGDLYLRDGDQTEQVDADAGGGGVFETASVDGSVAFFSKGGHLWRYQVATGDADDLTPSGGVAGVLGASQDGSSLYYQDASGLQVWHGGATTTVAPGAGVADSSDYPPATGTARVSADGTHLLFLSTAFSLTGYDNTDVNTGELVPQVYLYDGSGAGALICISCNPTNGRPIGPSTIPGAVPNGTVPSATNAYKPRALSADGRRAFFDSGDALAPTDTNVNHLTGAGIPDVYQWEAQGKGSCTRTGGCVALISSGRSAGGARFVDASTDGSDAFFLTDDSLVSADPGAVDLYDARIGGGFPDPPPPFACEGDACQVLPPEPVDPTITTRLSGRGNPPVRYHKIKHHRKKKQHKKKRTRRTGSHTRGSRR
jgi:hypothetical protein